jgi:ParB family chromosome partitioning protein
MEESMGVRRHDADVVLAPVPSPRDIGRRPLRNVCRIEISQVIPDPEQPREVFSEESLDRLAQSIHERGQLAPIRVRWSIHANKWVILTGERRWRAIKRAGLPTVDCIIHEADLTPSQILDEQLIENLLREDLTPVEEARAFARVMELNGWTGKQLAESLRIAPSRISRALAILKLPEDIQTQVETGVIPARSAYQISRLPSDNKRRQLASRVAAGTVTNEQAAHSVPKRRRRPKKQGVSLTFQTEEGWRITVTSTKKGNYEQLEQALCVVLDEVRLRIANNVRIF